MFVVVDLIAGNQYFTVRDGVPPLLEVWKYLGSKTSGHLVESSRLGLALLPCIVHRLELSRGNVADRLEKSAVVEPVDSFENRELDIFDVVPGPLGPDLLGLE